MTKLDVITGFLGAGKTTFLTRYTAWLAGQGIRYAVIENEFGRAGVDAALLEQRGARVLEISGGCVCCTLKVGLHDMLHALCGEVDRILLEPSGLFCGDDLLDIVNSPDMSIEPGFWLGIVDPLSFDLLNPDDMAVLESELIFAGSVAFSKTQFSEEKDIEKMSRDICRMLPAPAPVLYTAPWDTLPEDRWFPALWENGTILRDHERRRFDHTAMFESASMRPKRVFVEQEMQEVIDALTSDSDSEILRIKGTLEAPDGCWQVNYSPGCMGYEKKKEKAPAVLNIIGRNLNRKAIRTILSDRAM